MRIIKKKTLVEFSTTHSEAKGELDVWYNLMKARNYNTPHELKKDFAAVSIINAERVVFNIGGNKFRLIVSISYRCSIVFIKFIGTHAEYDKIDAATVSNY